MVVDLKLSFNEYEKEFPKDDMVTPAFKTFNNKFWPVMSRELHEFSGWSVPAPCLHGPYCHSFRCVKDLYEFSQKDQLRRSEARIQEIVEEGDILRREQNDINSFKAYLEDQELILLLPGVVPGFALHNRAWGRCI